MVTRIFRIFWRILIFLLGSISLWLVVTYFIPYVDKRVPSFFALLAAYSLLAYFIIPALIRLFRIFIKPNHIPHFATTGDGWPSDPVNIAIVVKNRTHLMDAMTKAGWHKADEENLGTTLRALKSMIFNTAYPNAPFSGLWLFGRKQDIGFEISTNRARSVRTRHHVRFWKLEQPSKAARHPQESFWYHKLRQLFVSKKEIWIGAATEDIMPIAIRWRSGQLTHGVSHDADRERDFIIQALRDNKLVRKEFTTDPGEEVTFRGQEFRTIFVTDGSIKVVELK
ncbi:MAG: hypothetical protein JWO61_237 [Candidatus Saccharibacteria bacterium]|nr:hypothetical protein [Candidatus Saccharibacteria bacterium]